MIITGNATIGGTSAILVDTIRPSTNTQLWRDTGVVVEQNLLVNQSLRVLGTSQKVGFAYESIAAPTALNANTTLTYAHIRGGIFTGLNTASGATYTLPLGTDMNTSMVNLAYRQSFQWSAINLSTSAGNIIIAASAGHTYVGNTTLTTNASYRCLTLFTALNTAITYRIAN